MTLLEICQWIENTPLGVEIRESIWWFPLLNLGHLLAMAVSAGTIAFVDLRLLGLGLRRAPVSQVAGQLLPWTWAGFVVLFITGSLLIVSEAVLLYGNAAFRIKVVLLLVAGLNVLIFHTTVYRKVAEWDLAPVAPLRARIAGSVSLFCWVGLIAAGRTIPYLE
jgi:hypothetical protein